MTQLPKLDVVGLSLWRSQIAHPPFAVEAARSLWARRTSTKLKGSSGEFVGNSKVESEVNLDAGIIDRALRFALRLALEDHHHAVQQASERHRQLRGRCDNVADERRDNAQNTPRGQTGKTDYENKVGIRRDRESLESRSGKGFVAIRGCSHGRSYPRIPRTRQLGRAAAIPRVLDLHVSDPALNHTRLNQQCESRKVEIFPEAHRAH